MEIGYVSIQRAPVVINIDISKNVSSDTVLRLYYKENVLPNLTSTIVYIWMAVFCHHFPLKTGIDSKKSLC